LVVGISGLGIERGVTFPRDTLIGHMVSLIHAATVLRIEPHWRLNRVVEQGIGNEAAGVIRLAIWRVPDRITRTFANSVVVKGFAVQL